MHYFPPHHYLCSQAQQMMPPIFQLSKPEILALWLTVSPGPPIAHTTPFVWLRKAVPSFRQTQALPEHIIEWARFTSVFIIHSSPRQLPLCKAIPARVKAAFLFFLCLSVISYHSVKYYYCFPNMSWACTLAIPKFP